MASKGSKGSKKDSNVPDGFEPANLQGEQYWCRAEVGKEILGDLLGRMERRNGGAFYRIRVDNKVECETGRGDDKHTVTAEPGTVINVDEKAALQDLSAYLPDGERHFKVFIRYEEKVEKGDRSFWRVTLGQKQTSGGRKAMSSTPF